MKHLITDMELVLYLEEGLTKEEVRSLKKRLEDDDQLDMLYHLQLSYDEGMREYADELIGEDDFELNRIESKVLKLPKHNHMAADYIICSSLMTKE